MTTKQNHSGNLDRVLTLLAAMLVLVAPAAMAQELDAESGEEDVDEPEAPFERPVFAMPPSPEEKAGTPSANSVSAMATVSDVITQPPKPDMKTAGYLQYKEQFSTNLFTGAAAYTYPIAVPPGIRGFEPVLLLSYNHHASKSIPSPVGAGWALSADYVYRDINSTMSDASDDFFVLHFNGLRERLIMTGEDEGRRYRTEHESDLLVNRVSGSGENDKGEYWLVRAKDGTEYRLGYNKKSELVSGMEPYVVRWMLDKVMDVHGNAIEYDYAEIEGDIGVVYLENVTYGASKVHFVYKKGIYSTPELYINGDKILQSGMLTEVEVSSDGLLVRKYLLDYQLLDYKPFLKLITETGNDGTSKLPPVQFAYTDFAVGFKEAPEWNIPSDSQFGGDRDEGVRMLDVNSDGLVDLVKAKGSSPSVRYNTGSGFGSFVALPSSLSGGFVDGSGNDNAIRFLDVNGDARIDVVQALSGIGETYKVMVSDGKQWKTASITLPPGVSFAEKASNPCTPGYADGYQCSETVSCDSAKCRRTCSKTTCGNSGTVVYSYTGDPKWNDKDYEEEDTSPSFTPQPNKCYEFEYTGSPWDDSDDSDCYDLYTDDDYKEGDYDKDCDGKDLDAYAGVGFEGNSGGSWLATIPPGSDYGFIGNVDNNYWSNRFLSKYDRDAVPDESGSNKGDWDGLESGICDEAGPNRVYCAPDYYVCQAWGKDRCGYGCKWENTRAFVVMGIYRSQNNNLWDALDDNEPECNGVVDDNDYFGDGTYKVTEYPTNTEYTYPECNKQQYTKDAGLRLVDFNGDGKTDLLLGTPASRKTWLNNGKEFKETSQWTLPAEAVFVDASGSDQGVRMADVNGDGLVDVLKGKDSTLITWLNTGREFVKDDKWKIPAEATFTKSENQGVQLVDINLDGMTDIVKAKDGSAGVWLNNGKGWEKKPWTTPAFTFDDFSHELVDVNGDSTLDVAKAISSEQKTWTGTNGNAGLLKSVKNSFGGVITLDYRQVSGFDNTGIDDVPDMGFSGYVVSSAEYDDGMGSKSAYSYEYADGFFDPVEREFRGFAKVTAAEPDATRLVQTFHQSSAMKGLVDNSQVYDSAGKLFEQTSHGYSATQGEFGEYIVRLSETNVSTYDGKGLPPLLVRTLFEYDQYGNPVRVSYIGRTDNADDDRAVAMQYAYNASAWIVDKPSTVTLYSSDGVTKARETKYSYDSQAHGMSPSKGLLTGEESVNIGGTSPVRSYEYDSRGNLAIETDPNGHQIQYGYDATGVFIAKITNALGHMTTADYDAGTGSIKQETDQNGITTTYGYDAFGRQTSTVRPYDSSDYPTTVVVYDIDGKPPESILVKERERPLIGETYDSRYYYDGFGRIVQIKSEAENGKQVRVNTIYDSSGRVKNQTNPHFVPSSDNYDSSGVDIPGMAYAYDALGRVVETTNPDASSRKTEYDRGALFVYDENGNRHDYLTDGFGNIVEVREHNNGEQYVTKYSYNAADNVVRITDAEGNIILYQYDAVGRKAGLNDPDIGEWSYEYDAAGNLVNQTDSNGRTITLQYDSLNRQISKSSESETISYQYDEDKKGTLSRITMPLGEVILGYDDRLRARSIEEKYDGTSFVITRDYDSMDRITKVTYPDGSVSDYSYNRQGLPKKVWDVITGVDYAAHNVPVERHYANGLVSETEYDSKTLRPVRIRTGSMQDFHYQYDKAGNMLQISDAAGGSEYTMGYDPLDRLTQAKKAAVGDEGYEFRYTYDPLGNILEIERDGIINYAFEYGESPVHAPLALKYEAEIFGPDGARILTPENNSLFSKKEVLVKWQGSKHLDDCNYVLNGGKGTENICPDGQAKKFTLKAREGANELYIEGTNKEGYLGASGKVTFILDTTPPKITIIEPAKGKTQRKVPVILKWEADEKLYWCTYLLDSNMGEEFCNKAILAEEPAVLPPENEAQISEIEEGTHTIILEGEDQAGNKAASEPVTFKFDTSPVSVEITSPKEEDVVVKETDLVKITVEADYNGDYDLKYSISDLRFSQGGNVFTWQTGYDDAGEYNIKITATDGDVEDSVNLLVKVENVNRPPRIVSTTPQRSIIIPEGEVAVFEVKAEDPDNDPLSYLWKLEGQTVSTMDSFEFEPGFEDSGQYKLDIEVSDKLLSDFRHIAITVADMDCKKGDTRPCGLQEGVCSGSVEKCSQGKWLGCTEDDYKANNQFYEREEASCDQIDNDCDGVIDEERACNKAPLMQRLGDFTVAEGQLLQFKVTATDAEQDALTYDAVPLPEGAEFDTKNGIFTWIPGSAQSGTYFMTISATDGLLISTQQTKITVTDANQKPVITSATYDTTIKEGEKIELSITATDPDGDRISYEWRKEGKVISLSETYLFAPKQGDTGVHKFNATANDGRLTDSRIITVIVEKAGECKEGEMKSCLLTLGVCAGAKATCISGAWQECAPQTYGPRYQSIETSCDGLDNDCDGRIDEECIQKTPSRQTGKQWQR